jgi:hypothetical protein
MGNLLKEVVKELKKDKELNNIGYDTKNHTLMFGLDQQVILDSEFDDETATDYVQKKMFIIGNRIANTNKLKFFNKLICKDESMFSFETTFTRKGEFLEIADELWSIENPVFVS